MQIADCGRIIVFWFSDFYVLFDYMKFLSLNFFKENIKSFLPTVGDLFQEHTAS